MGCRSGQSERVSGFCCGVSRWRWKRKVAGAKLSRRLLDRESGWSPRDRKAPEPSDAGCFSNPRARARPRALSRQKDRSRSLAQSRPGVARKRASASGKVKIPGFVTCSLAFSIPRAGILPPPAGRSPTILEDPAQLPSLSGQFRPGLKCARALRSGALEICISPWKGVYVSMIK